MSVKMQMEDVNMIVLTPLETPLVTAMWVTCWIKTAWTAVVSKITDHQIFVRITCVVEQEGGGLLLSHFGNSVMSHIKLLCHNECRLMIYQEATDSWVQSCLECTD